MAWAGCAAGLLLIDEYREKLISAGFMRFDVEISPPYNFIATEGIFTVRLVVRADIVCLKQCQVLLSGIKNRYCSRFEFMLTRFKTNSSVKITRIKNHDGKIKLNYLLLKSWEMSSNVALNKRFY